MNELFKSFNEIAAIFDDSLTEISVARHRISLEFMEKMIPLYSINKFYDKAPDVKDKSFLAVNEDILFLVCELEESVLENKEKQGLFQTFIKVTDEIFEKVCKCPVFEFVISDKYIKIYLDKQGLTTEDLEAYEEIFELKGEGTLELHAQRPYLLFVNIDFNEGDSN